jgi:hypothetical protein
MKKTVIFITLILSLMSCLQGGGISRTYPVEATFEYQGLDYGAQFGEDSLYFNVSHGYGFGWDYLTFRHKVDTVGKSFDGGMLLSYLKGSKFNPTDSLSMAQTDSAAFANDAFRQNSSLMFMGSKTYAVYYENPDALMMPDSDFEFMGKEIGTCQLGQCYVNNTRYVAYKASKHFVAGDRLTLQATGYHKGVKTGETSIALIDFSAQKDSIVSRWTPFDLSRLGIVDHVDFKVLSTKKEVPAYFCMDNFWASITISSN